MFNCAFFRRQNCDKLAVINENRQKAQKMQIQEILKFFESNIFQSHANHQLTIQNLKKDQKIPLTEANETFPQSIVIRLQKETQTDKNRKKLIFLSKNSVETVKIISSQNINFIQLRLPSMLETRYLTSNYYDLVKKTKTKQKLRSKKIIYQLYNDE